MVPPNDLVLPFLEYGTRCCIGAPSPTRQHFARFVGLAHTDLMNARERSHPRQTTHSLAPSEARASRLSILADAGTSVANTRCPYSTMLPADRYSRDHAHATRSSSNLRHAVHSHCYSIHSTTTILLTTAARNYSIIPLGTGLIYDFF